MIDDLRQDAGSRNEGSAYLEIIASFVQQNTRELQPAADFNLTVIQLDHIAFADSILPRSVLKNCVHHRLRIHG